MEFREKRLTEGHRDARRAMAEPSSSSSLSRFTPPVHPIPLSAARSCGCSSPTGTPAAVLGSCPLDSGELKHSGSHASDTASNKGHRRRRGHLTEHVPHRVMLFVRLRSRGTALAGSRDDLEGGCSRRWMEHVWAGEWGQVGAWNFIATGGEKI